jgi:signal peptide peptidase SppA
MRYSHIISAVMATPWAIRHEKLSAILAFLQFKADGGEVAQDEIALIKEAAKEPVYLAISDSDGALTLEAGAPSSSSRSQAGQVAVLPISGTISHRMGTMSEMSGGTSTERFTQWLRAAVNDPTVKAIVLDINSPGGTVDGVPELADEIYKANQIKPVTAVANAQAASAAYWLASQAKELVVTPSGQVGSIGVFGAHQDMSKALESEGVKVSLISAGRYKTEGNPFEPLSDEARAALQDSVNAYYDQFAKAVARGRSSDPQAVKDGFGQGRMVSAQKAVKMGMADRVATLDQTLARLGARTAMPKSLKAEAEPAKVISEGFEWKEGAAMPISPIDGYAYSPSELTHSSKSRGTATFTRKVDASANPIADAVLAFVEDTTALDEAFAKQTEGASPELLAQISLLEQEIELDAL